MLKKMTSILIASLISMQALAELPECGIDAAEEFGVPAKVFEALALHAAEIPQPMVGGHKNYGPMAIYELAISSAAEGVNTSTDSVKTDECTNYRAAAWFLMDSPVTTEANDIWDRVTKYYYGRKMQSTYPMTDRVKQIYKNL